MEGPNGPAPPIAGPFGPITLAKMKDMIKMVAKQSRIIERSRDIITTARIGLHYVVPEIGLTLCQILMAMRSSRDHKKQLFMAVDERRGGIYSIVFTVHQDGYPEANSIIPVLWVILRAEFGPKAWEWFTDMAKQTSQGYNYDPKTGQLKNTEDDEADDKINDDDDGSKDSDDSSIDSDDNLVHEFEEHLNMTDVPDTFHVDIKFVFDEADAAGNQFGDTGSVNTFRSLCHSLYIKDNHDEYTVPTTIQVKPTYR
jgi:hypothetical protein